ncbi:MAG: hypothetical protein HC945_04395 [Nitrosarchaeum sp.]|nr:hypothetical protein [Nitrosarchaeum sp.]
MLTPRFVRENVNLVRANIQRQKGSMEYLEAFLRLDESWRKAKKSSEDLRSERNKLSLRVSELRKEGKDAQAELARAKLIPAQIKKQEEDLVRLEQEMSGVLARIPNIMHEAVPFGTSDAQNVEVKRWGEPAPFAFPVRNHVELCEHNGWADFDASARTSGNGFYFLLGDLALLSQALVRFGVEYMCSRGYVYVEPPLMLHRDVILAAGDASSFAQSIYATDHEDLCLIGTAEHAILGMHAGRTFEEGQLPLKYFGYSMCFRKEIGAHGIN